jgi:hypothetical protein
MVQELVNEVFHISKTVCQHFQYYPCPIGRAVNLLLLTTILALAIARSDRRGERPGIFLERPFGGLLVPGQAVYLVCDRPDLYMSYDNIQKIGRFCINRHLPEDNVDVKV